MKVTVILCTFNRSERLRNALRNLALSDVSELFQWTVLVVDNNSRDDTREVVEEFCTRFPNNFQYRFEPRQGKSFALNTGIREASGDVLAFMDDDVEVDRYWLSRLAGSLRDSSWSGVGGRILPEKGFALPPWLNKDEKDALAPLALFDMGDEAREIHEAPFGANMAFRTEMFEKYGHFRTDLGPQPGSEIRNEDTEFGLRLLRAGERLWYEPSAVVYHEMPATRICERYFLAWWFDKARADVRQNGVPQEAKWRIGGVPVYLFRRMLRWGVQWIFSVRASRRFSCKAKLWTVSGTIAECYRKSRLGS
jgi:glycosyltransferase involved in cell wall biosynthesis